MMHLQANLAGLCSGQHCEHWTVSHTGGVSQPKRVAKPCCVPKPFRKLPNHCVALFPPPSVPSHDTAHHRPIIGDEAPDLVFCMTKHFWREGVTTNNVKNRGSSVDIISQAFHYELCKAVEFCFTIYVGFVELFL